MLWRYSAPDTLAQHQIGLHVAVAGAYVATRDEMRWSRLCATDRDRGNVHTYPALSRVERWEVGDLDFVEFIVLTSRKKVRAWHFSRSSEKHR
jgi:hypothetical protein